MLVGLGVVVVAAVVVGLLVLWFAPANPHPKGRDAPPVHRVIRRLLHSPACSSRLGQLCDCAPDLVVECPVCGRLPRSVERCPNAE